MSVCGQFFQMESLIVQERRIVKTLETVLARYTRCELFLARFYDARLREFQYFIKKKLKFVSACKVCSIMQERRIVKTLETVLARYTRCELFLARFYDARLQEFQYFIKKKLDFVSVCKVCSIMQEHRIVKTLETVLACFTSCELFLARFYDARLQESLHITMKKLEAVSECRRSMIMQKLRIVKTLETVLARGAVCFFVLTFVFPLSS